MQMLDHFGKDDHLVLGKVRPPKVLMLRLVQIEVEMLRAGDLAIRLEAQRIDRPLEDLGDELSQDGSTNVQNRIAGSRVRTNQTEQHLEARGLIGDVAISWVPGSNCSSTDLGGKIELPKTRLCLRAGSWLVSIHAETGGLVGLETLGSWTFDFQVLAAH